MKKTIAKLLCLLVCAALCLSVTGCAPVDERAFERACALLEDGEYEAAIEAFTAIGMYEEISEKIEEAQELLNEENSEFLYGKWVSINTGDVFTFSKGGKGSIRWANDEMTIVYTCDGKNVVITEPYVIRMKVDKEDGITHIKDQDGLYDLVPEDEYEEIAPQTVEITMDNWQEYFELREAEDISLNAFGEIEWRDIGYGIFLKEEYQQKVENVYNNVQISFEVQYDRKSYLVEGELFGEEYSLTEGSPRWGWDEETGLTMVRDVYWYEISERRHADSDLNNAVCAFFSDMGWTEENGKTYVHIVANPEVIRVTGTLTLQG